MKLSKIKELLPTLDNVLFQLENGAFVPENFHVTEVGIVTKKFIDCGGIVRNENVVNFQLWNANDFEHRLTPGKLLSIIQLSEEKLEIDDNLKIEVEYQNGTIGKYDLSFEKNIFILKDKKTACLAEDACGVSTVKPKIKLSELKNSCCTPNSSCC